MEKVSKKQMGLIAIVVLIIIFLIWRIHNGSDFEFENFALGNDRYYNEDMIAVLGEPDKTEERGVDYGYERTTCNNIFTYNDVKYCGRHFKTEFYNDPEFIRKIVLTYSKADEKFFEKLNKHCLQKYELDVGDTDGANYIVKCKTGNDYNLNLYIYKGDDIIELTYE